VKVVLSLDAEADLTEIWLWNAEERGVRHADDYISFLREHIAKLETRSDIGTKIDLGPDYRYILMKRRSGGHGHIAVYQIRSDEILVVHVFHTSQDWRAKL
jgi:plasmid stabilization system protein ParE